MPYSMIYPKDVVCLEKRRALPLHIRIAWLRKMRHDAVGDAEKRLMRQMEWRIAAGVSLVFAALCFDAALWGVPMPMLDHGSRPPPFLWIIMGVIWSLLGLIFIGRGGETVAEFATWPSNFGAELRKLCMLLNVKYDVLHGWSREDLLEQAHIEMTKHAKNFLVSQKRNEEHRTKRLEPGWMPLGNEEAAREAFNAKFELLGTFGLSDGKGWSAYFNAAKAELEREVKAEEPAT